MQARSAEWKTNDRSGVMLATHLRADDAPSFVPMVKAHERSLVDPGTLARPLRSMEWIDWPFRFCRVATKCDADKGHWVYRLDW
jgi:hypothetical protein